MDAKEIEAQNAEMAVLLGEVQNVVDQGRLGVLTPDEVRQRLAEILL